MHYVLKATIFRTSQIFGEIKHQDYIDLFKILSNTKKTTNHQVPAHLKTFKRSNSAIF